MTRDARNLKGPGCLWAAGAFFCLLLIGYGSARLFQPEKLAALNRCIGPYADADPPLQNTCDRPVNTELCLYGKSGKEICRTLTLAPGEGFDRDAIAADLASLGGLLRAETYACKPPHMPGMVEDMNTKRMKQGCLPEGETRN